MQRGHKIDDSGHSNSPYVYLWCVRNIIFIIGSEARDRKGVGKRVWMRMKKKDRYSN